MSAVEAITAALAVGAGAGMKDTTSAAVMDAYAGLKTRLSGTHPVAPAPRLT